MRSVTGTNVCRELSVAATLKLSHNLIEGFASGNMFWSENPRALGASPTTEACRFNPYTRSRGSACCAMPNTTEHFEWILCWSYATQTSLSVSVRKHTPQAGLPGRTSSGSDMSSAIFDPDYDSYRLSKRCFCEGCQRGTVKRWMQSEFHVRIRGPFCPPTPRSVGNSFRPNRTVGLFAALA
jgi:hypothetical protein